MKRVNLILAIQATVLITALAAVPAFAGGILAEDHFAYADGSLVPNGGWANHSGTMGDLLVASGVAVVEHGTPSEDANLAFTPTAGTLYYGFTFSVDDLGSPYSGTDNEYFIHFRTGTAFSARVDVVPPTGAGDFSIGIASDDAVADAIWATDLTFGTTYKVVVRYDQVSNIATLWVDPTSEASTSITGDDQPDPGDSVDSIALRQSDSSENETVRVDDVVVGTDFDSVLALVPVELQSFSID